MKRFNAIVIDDERLIREVLVMMLEDECPEIRVCGYASSAAEGRSLLKRLEPDLIFLDISMPKENGFEFLRSVPKGKYGVIFTTAYHENALQEMKVRSIDYLLKPVSPADLREVVANATREHESRQGNPELQKSYAEALESLYDHFRIKL